MSSARSNACRLDHADDVRDPFGPPPATGPQRSMALAIRRDHVDTIARRFGPAPLRERLLPARAIENLIKLHNQLASDRMSCHSAIANQVRLVLHTAAF
jgi:hypothetical protein